MDNPYSSVEGKEEEWTTFDPLVVSPGSLFPGQEPGLPTSSNVLQSCFPLVFGEEDSPPLSSPKKQLLPTSCSPSSKHTLSPMCGTPRMLLETQGLHFTANPHMSIHAYGRCFPASSSLMKLHNISNFKYTKPQVNASLCFKKHGVYIQGFPYLHFIFWPHERECLARNDITSGSEIKKKIKLLIKSWKAVMLRLITTPW